MSSLPKKYGLLLKKPTKSSNQFVKPVAAAFADDEDNGNEIPSSSKVSASTIRMQIQAKRQHEKALAEDPTVFDYDTIYDDLQAKKNEKIALVKAADKERKSKYAEQILEMHKKRVLAQQSREERKQQKEREAEAGQFDDKEKFVTSAYRQQLAEMEKFRLQEAAEIRLDEMTAVEKQKSGMWKGGFYRTLLNDIARDGNGLKKEETQIKQEVNEPENAPETSEDSQKYAKKLSFLRKSSNQDEVLLRTDEISNKSMKKLIYSDTSDDEPETISAAAVELKPGLNILKPQIKKPTKAEQVRRRFTPSPEHSALSSSDEKSPKEQKRQMKKKDYGRKRNHVGRKEKRKSPSPGVRTPTKHLERRSHENRHHEKNNKEHKKSDGKQKNEKQEENTMKRVVKERTKEERFQIVRKILAHRNSAEEIEKMRQRYLLRRSEKCVSLPL